MIRTLVHAKIHRATVTGADFNYVGSITIDEDLLDAAGIWPFERVQVVDVNNGNRLETYAIVGEHETDAERGRISYRSPLGAALLKKSVDDEVVINTPRGKRALTIVHVVYQPVD